MPAQQESEPSGEISVVLVDDHAVVRSALRKLLEEEPDIVVLAEGGDAASAVRYANGHRPDVLVLDLNLPDEPGLAAVPRILDCCPETNIVVLTMNESTEAAREALRAGVQAYILKEAAEQELLTAVRLAAQSRPYVQPALGARLATEHEEEGPPNGLTEREAEVLHLIALGYTNSEIAARLYLSIRTIESHRAGIQGKLDLHSRAELVRYAIQHGLADL